MHIAKPALFVVGLLLTALARPCPASLTFTMVIDELTVGRAVLAGELRDLDWGQGTEIPAVGLTTYARQHLVATRPDGTPTHCWHAEMNIRRYELAAPTVEHPGTSYWISGIKGRHKVAPHLGEDAPGPPLGTASYDDIAGLIGGGAPDPLQFHFQQPHDQLTHLDTMDVTLLDLNGAAPGVLFSPFDEIRMVIDFHHTPAPGALALLTCSGLAGGWPRRRRSC